MGARQISPQKRRRRRDGAEEQRAAARRAGRGRRGQPVRGVPDSWTGGGLRALPSCEGSGLTLRSSRRPCALRGGEREPPLLHESTEVRGSAAPFPRGRPAPSAVRPGVLPSAAALHPAARRGVFREDAVPGTERCGGKRGPPGRSRDGRWPSRKPWAPSPAVWTRLRGREMRGGLPALSVLHGLPRRRARWQAPGRGAVNEAVTALPFGTDRRPRRARSVLRRRCAPCDSA